MNILTQKTQSNFSTKGTETMRNHKSSSLSEIKNGRPLQGFKLSICFIFAVVVGWVFPSISSAFHEPCHINPGALVTHVQEFTFAELLAKAQDRVNNPPPSLPRLWRIGCIKIEGTSGTIIVGKNYHLQGNGLYLIVHTCHFGNCGDLQTEPTCDYSWNNTKGMFACASHSENQPGKTQECKGCQKTLSGRSTIQVEGQVLGETVPITGTPFNLVYNSDRVPGYKTYATLKIPLTDDTVDSFLRRIKLTVTVAGRKFTYEYDNDPATTSIPDITPNLTHDFADWDGLDAYGRQVSGAVNAHIKIETFNNTIFTSSNFGLPSGSFAKHPVSGIKVPTRQFEKRGQEYTTPMEIHDIRSLGLGGWTLDALHFYDPNARTLHTGAGPQLSPQDLTSVITTVADLGPGATPGDMEFDSQGNLYFADGANHRIQKMDTNGIITTVAGDGTPGTGTVECSPAQDGRPATVAKLNNPKGIFIDKDDNLYIADAGNFCIRKVNTQGNITTLVGSGVQGHWFTNTDPRLTRLNAPVDIAMDSLGTLYIMEGLSTHPYFF